MGGARDFPTLFLVRAEESYLTPSQLHLSCQGQLTSYTALAKIKRHIKAGMSKIKRHVLIGLIPAMPWLRKRSRNGAARKESTAAVAHDGRVTGILPTPDGLHWLTAGTDNRLRLWDTRHNYHLLVNYPQTFNSSMKVDCDVTHTSEDGCPSVDQSVHVAVVV